MVKDGGVVQAAPAGNPKTQKKFNAFNSCNRQAVLYQMHNARRPETLGPPNREVHRRARQAQNHPLTGSI
jgi:hypothetical protein